VAKLLNIYPNSKMLSLKVLSVIGAKAKLNILAPVHFY